MTDVLKPIWPLLEAGDTTLTAMGWLRLPIATRQALESTGIAKPAGYSERIPCPTCTTPHIETVITKTRRDGSTQYFIRCPREMRVEVNDQDRQRWRLDVFALAKAIAGSAGLAGEVKPVRGDRLIHLGQHSFRGVRTEVYFARGLGRKDASSVISALPVSVLPSIVFVPSAVPAEDAWGQMPPRVFPLASCHTYIDGRVGVDARVIDAAMRRHLQGDLHPDHVFRRKGEFWDVAFAGSEIVHLKDSKGMRYIARLLWEPDRAITAVDLLVAEAGIDPRQAMGSSGEEIDDQGRREMRELYAGLLEERAKAEKAQDETARSVIQAEIETVESELLRRLGLDGKARETTDIDRHRKAVSTAVRRGIQQCQKHLPELWRYLTLTISTGTTMKYAPPEPIEWILD